MSKWQPQVWTPLSTVGLLLLLAFLAFAFFR